MFGTADKEFTGESRGTGPAAGAYTDDKGHFKVNTDGPGGNTALTGREGTAENNPVAQAQAKAGDTVGSGSNSATATPSKGASTASQAGSEKKKGIFQKIKDALE